MVFHTPPYLENFFKLQDPFYQESYKNGFDACKEEIQEDIKKLLKKIKRLEAFKTATSSK